VLNSPSRFKFAVCTEIRRNVNVLSFGHFVGQFPFQSMAVCNGHVLNIRLIYSRGIVHPPHGQRFRSEEIPTFGVHFDHPFLALWSVDIDFACGIHISICHKSKIPKLQDFFAHLTWIYNTHPTKL